jgi:hypothetical protein
MTKGSIPGPHPLYIDIRQKNNLIISGRMLSTSTSADLNKGYFNAGRYISQ